LCDVVVVVVEDAAAAVCVIVIFNAKIYLFNEIIVILLYI
jgi:hypothetical protein